MTAKRMYSHSGKLPALGLSALIVAGLFTMSGCSHVAPYYRHSPGQAAPEGSPLRYRLLLLGDAGAPREDEPTLKVLTEWASRAPDRSMVIFLGDNVYDHGMPLENSPMRAEMERRLQSQIDVIANSGARGFFVAGNHDWHQGLPGVIRQSEYIRASLRREDAFLPRAGCVGPVKLDVEHLRIIALDTDIWLNPDTEPLADCPQRDLQASLSALKEMVNTARDRHVIVVAHHPLDTHGIHGGFYDWRYHIFPLRDWHDWMWLPLPIVGSLYPLLRWHAVRHFEETNSDTYKEMQAAFREAFTRKKPLLYAAGHDHNLQVLEGNSASYILVSGAGIDSRLSCVTHGDNTLFAHLHTGFLVVDFLQSGRVWLYVVEPGDTEIVFSLELDTQ